MKAYFGGTFRVGIGKICCEVSYKNNDNTFLISLSDCKSIVSSNLCFYSHYLLYEKLLNKIVLL